MSITVPCVLKYKQTEILHRILNSPICQHNQNNYAAQY